MLIKKGDKLIVAIPKEEKDVPSHVWAHTPNKDKKEFLLMI